MELNIYDQDFPPDIDRGNTVSMVIKSFKGRKNVEVHLFRYEWTEEDLANNPWDDLLGDPIEEGMSTDPAGSKKVYMESFTPTERDTIVAFLQEQYGERLASITAAPLPMPIPLGLTPLSEIPEGKNIGVIRFERIKSFESGIPLHGLFDLSQHEPIVEVKE